MFGTKSFKAALLTGAVIMFPGTDAMEAAAQDALPEVTVVQQQRVVPRAQRRGKSAPSRQRVNRPARPKPVQAQPVQSQAGPLVPAPVDATGDSGGAELDTLTPINTYALLPSDLQNFAGAGDRISDVEIDEFRPRNASDALQRVPGVLVVNDDGFARHVGIGIRGAPPRRSRKVLVMEDGQSINFSTYIDPSLHYTPPVDRVEAIEVLKGGVVSYGPLNNYGVVNFRNLSPFGAPETVVSGAVGNLDSNMRHFHHRAQSGNFGYVASYSGAESDGAWNNERLRYNDFFGALGWQGLKQDLTVSGGYFRQRDNYDEQNASDDQLREFRRCKSCFEPGSDFNTYNADHYRMQVGHNFYLDKDTTISTKVYGQYADRPRFENEGDPANPGFEEEEEDEEEGAEEEGDDAEGEEEAEGEGEEEGERVGFMNGRERLYRYGGAETRIQLANRPFFWGMTQDIQAGIRYERHAFDYKIGRGRIGEILNFDNRSSITDQLREEYDANTAAAFIQSGINVTNKLTLVPGIRFEYSDLRRETRVNELATVDLPITEQFDEFHPLPMLNYSYRMTDKINFYGGAHRGWTPHVARGEGFPLPQELGNNFQAGLRTTAIKGVTLDVAYFHSDVKDFQIKEAFTDAIGNNVFSSVDVEIDGVELYGRLDTSAYTGWALNPYFEGIYTYADNVIDEGFDFDEDGGRIDVAGNLTPENPREAANLTLGVEHKSGWDASVSFNYRGEFFTDVQNRLVDPEDEGEIGIVDDVWLINARANYTIPGTNATLFVTGYNLEDKFYITDREDGAKPGQGRQIMGGLKVKFNHDKPLLASWKK